MTDFIYSVLDFLDHLIRVRAGILVLLVFVALILALQVSTILCLRAIRVTCEEYLDRRRNDLAPAAWGKPRETSSVEGQTNLPSGL